MTNRNENTMISKADVYTAIKRMVIRKAIAEGKITEEQYHRNRIRRMAARIARAN